MKSGKYFLFYLGIALIILFIAFSKSRAQDLSCLGALLFQYDVLDNEGNNLGQLFEIEYGEEVKDLCFKEKPEDPYTFLARSDKAWGIVGFSIAASQGEYSLAVEYSVQYDGQMSPYSTVVWILYSHENNQIIDTFLVHEAEMKRTDKLVSFEYINPLVSESGNFLALSARNLALDAVHSDECWIFHRPESETRVSLVEKYWSVELDCVPVVWDTFQDTEVLTITLVESPEEESSLYQEGFEISTEIIPVQ